MPIAVEQVSGFQAGRYGQVLAKVLRREQLRRDQMKFSSRAPGFDLHTRPGQPQYYDVTTALTIACTHSSNR